VTDGPGAHLANRLFLLLGIMVFGLACVLVQAWRLQVGAADRLAARARWSSTRLFSLQSVRGDIYDRNRIKLATSVAVDSVSVDRRALSDATNATWLLSRALLMDYDDLASTVGGIRGTGYVRRHVTRAEAEAVRALDLHGVILEKEYRREYPNGAMAANLLGFVGHAGNGLEGLEAALDDELTAEPMEVRIKRDNYSRLFMDDGSQSIEQPKGASVVLTIDSRIQSIAERAVGLAVAEFNAASGMAVVVRPGTGEILAMAVVPTFDPNDFLAYDEKYWRNRTLTHPFEPGSTLKIFTVAAALEEGLIDPDTVFFCENGLWYIDGQQKPIRDTGSYGDLSVKQIIQKSSNIGASKIGQLLGPVKHHHYLSRFGFGSKTGLSHSSGESAGIMRDPGAWQVLDAASIAFGQGISTTALQLAMATSALAYDGVLLRPILVSRVVGSDGRIIRQEEKEIVRKVVSPVVAQHVLAMMRMAALKDGTGRRADIKAYPVALKTGTAQRTDTGSKGYSVDKFVASIVGVAPYNNPELCVLVVLDDPKPSHHGGVVAAKAFREIMGQSLQLLEVPPYEGDEEMAPNWPTALPPKPGAPGVPADGRPPANQLRVRLDRREGHGPIPPWRGPASERPALVFDAPPDVAVASAAAPPAADDGEAPDPLASVMPDVSGMTMRAALDLLSRHELVLEYQGSGVAMAQDPPVGAVVGRGDLARVVFGPASP
jgi:cell division protein FtsI (penicillin-binding protein 3)